MIDNLFFTALFTIIGSFTLVLYLIPKIKFIVEQRQLTDHPDQRSSHKVSTPSMAGVSFFITLLIVIILTNRWDLENIGINLIGALTIIFALGLKDDLIVSTPRAKIGGEVLAICFILFCNCIQVTTLNGFLGINNISFAVSSVLTILMILTIINAYNLIDGIDGLASTIGIVIFSIFGIIFFATGVYFYFLICTCLIAIQLAYLRYNLSSTKKIFMGDTGSLIIGFCIGFLSLKFLSMEASLFHDLAFNPENKLYVIAAIMYIPLFDTFRVIVVRLLNNKSPFSPDNNHIHHILIDSGLSHFKSSLFLGFLNLGLAIFFIFLSFHFSSFQMIWILLLTSLLLLGIFNKLKNNVRIENEFKYLVKAIRFFF